MRWQLNRTSEYLRRAGKQIREADVLLGLVVLPLALQAVVVTDVVAVVLVELVVRDAGEAFTPKDHSLFDGKANALR